MIWLHITLLEGISLEQIGFMFCFSLRWELILTRRTSLRTTRCRCLGRSPFPLGVSQVWTQNVNGLCCLYTNCHFGFIFLDKPTNHLVGIVFVILHGFPWIVEAISTFYWLDDLSFFERSSPHRMCLNGGARVCGELKKTTHSLLKGWNGFFSSWWFQDIFSSWCIPYYIILSCWMDETRLMLKSVIYLVLVCSTIFWTQLLLRPFFADFHWS
jgi:hypothetical protein